MLSLIVLSVLLLIVVIFALQNAQAVTVRFLFGQLESSVAVVAFVGGFSERFFLRSLARITGAPDQSRSAHPSDRGLGQSE